MTDITELAQSLKAAAEKRVTATGLKNLATAGKRVVAQMTRPTADSSSRTS